VSDAATGARLAAWRKAIGQLARRMPEVVAAINGSAGKLSKRDLGLRGVGGQVTGASAEGITTKTIAGKTEQYAWQQVGAEAWQALLPLVPDPAADDWLAAGVHAIACGDPQAGRKYLEQAAGLGADITPVLESLAAESFAEADRQYQAAVAALEKRDLKAAREALTAAEKQLGDLTAEPATTGWAAEQKQLVDALEGEVAAARHELEAEELYRQAVELAAKAKTGGKRTLLFEVKLLVDRLANEYPTSGPVGDSARKPSFAELQDAVKDLGRFITVRKDGKGDYTTVQAAIDAALPNSLIEIQDSSLYTGKLKISETKPGLVIRGADGSWPIVYSKPEGYLVHVLAPGTVLEHFVLVMDRLPDKVSSVALTLSSTFAIFLGLPGVKLVLA